ncbi:MAG: phage tail protein, partial [Treponema sp.]|nr:phage tail protein [Treponema sp.]
MVIGSWGDFVFEASGHIAKTFQELSQKSSGRWAEHETINTAPLSEFLGPGLDELEISIIFTTMLGVNPKESYEELRTAVRKGEYYPLILGGFPLSDNLWRFTEIS